MFKKKTIEIEASEMINLSFIWIDVTVLMESICFFLLFILVTI